MNSEGGSLRPRSLALFAVCATLLWAGAIYGAPPTSEPPGQNRITKTLTFAMPACPIEAATVPLTREEFTLPDTNPLGIIDENGEVSSVSVTGTVQVTDQTGGTVILLGVAADADLTGVAFARTVKSIAHATGELTFNRGCTSTDPYGSNNCFFHWGESITAGLQGALQENITSGKLIVDTKIDRVDDTIPFSFVCRVCGANCTITIPEQIDDGGWEQVLRLMIRLIRFPFSL